VRYDPTATGMSRSARSPAFWARTACSCRPRRTRRRPICGISG